VDSVAGQPGQQRESVTPAGTRGRILPASVTAVGAAAVAVSLGARALHYSGLALPDALQGGIGDFLELTFSLVLVQLTVLLPVSIGVAGLLVAAWRFKRGAILRFTDAGWQTRLYVHAFIWLQIFLANFLLDLDPRLGLSFGAGGILQLALASPGGRRWRRGRSGSLWLAWLGLFVALAPFQRAPVDLLSLGVWCAAQPWLTGVLSRAADWRDRLWPLALSVMAGQLLASSVPYFLSDPAPPFVAALFLALRYATYRFVVRPRRWLVRLPLGAVGLVVALAVGWELAQRYHLEGRGAGGTLLGPDLAYNFCESAERGLLAVTIPACSGPGGPECVLGRIDLFRLDSLERTNSIRPFDLRFSGRMEQIVCEDERLLVGMCCASPGDQRDRLAVMSLGWEGEVLAETLVPDHETNRVLVDRDGGALWLAGNDLVHLDVATGKEELLASRRPPGIFVVERASASARRDSVFVGEFINASVVRELDRVTLEQRRAIDTDNGSVVAATVDDPLGRLWVTGLWGVEVFDLASGERIAARRLGFASRTPLVDERRGLVYVPATTSGKIYVLDRDDARLLGAIAIGFGPRNAFLADEGRWFLASSEHGLWYWDASELAARFTSGRPAR
jgi:hypothetical protein